MSTLLKSKIHAAKKATRRNIEAQRKRMKLLDHPAIAETWEMFPLSLRRKINVYVSDWNNVVFMNVTLDKLDSLKDDTRLVRVLEPFTTNVWTAAETSDWTGGDKPARDYRFNRKLEGFRLHVTIQAYVKEDSPTCRIVTRVHEEVVKREERVIVCA